MKIVTHRRLYTLAVIAAGLVAFGWPQLGIAAQSPFGVGVPETTAPITSGPLAGFFGYVAAKQAAFYQALTGAVGRLKQDGTAIWLLAGLSFAYGVFHAAGPGHGKAVISAYVLANEETAKRGVLLAFAAAFVQALSAIILISVAALILGLTSMAITQTTRGIEIASYILVTMLGLWLVWIKIIKPAMRRSRTREADQLGHDHSGHGHDGHSHEGHSHVPASAALNEPLTMNSAWSAVLAVGVRPCTGALVVLVFAMSQGLYLAGILSTLVMAAGTGLTVAVLATLAVSAKGLALRLVGGSTIWADRFHRLIEAGGAVMVLGLGLILLTAAIGFRG